MLSALSPFPVRSLYRALLFLKRAMESPSSCVPTTSSSGESSGAQHVESSNEAVISRAD